MPDFDQRGTGLSDRPSQRYSMKLWADDCALLLDALGVERAHVHGSRELALNIATQVCSRAFLDGEQGAATVESIREPSRVSQSLRQTREGSLRGHQ